MTSKKKEAFLEVRRRTYIGVNFLVLDATANIAQSIFQRDTVDETETENPEETIEAIKKLIGDTEVHYSSDFSNRIRFVWIT